MAKGSRAWWFMRQRPVSRTSVDFFLPQPRKSRIQVNEKAGEDHVRNKRPGVFCSRSESALLFAVISLPVSVVARAVPNQGQTPEGARIAEAVRVDRAPKLDGTFDDPLWQMAKPITDFRSESQMKVNQQPKRRKYAFSTLELPFILEFIATIQSHRELSPQNYAAM